MSKGRRDDGPTSDTCNWTAVFNNPLNFFNGLYTFLNSKRSEEVINFTIVFIICLETIFLPGLDFNLIVLCLLIFCNEICFENKNLWSFLNFYDIRARKTIKKKTGYLIVIPKKCLEL